jgi:hypothetical protein
MFLLGAACFGWGLTFLQNYDIASIGSILLVVSVCVLGFFGDKLQGIEQYASDEVHNG